MTKISINNSLIQASFSPKGAELTSLQMHGKEYIWQADPEIWNRHAPVLFPIVGRLIEDTYQVNGKNYHLSQHGFARDSDFALVEQNDSSVKFLLESDPETLKVYPFSFKLYITYLLVDQSLQVQFEVENPSDETIWFSIGGHPAFNCPLDPQEENFTDYEVDFHDDKQEKELYHLEGHYLGGGKRSIALNNGKLELDYSLFRNDALIIDSHAPYKTSVRSRKSGAGFSMDYEDFQWLGIWTKQKDAGFLCLEPWNGIADTVQPNQSFKEKLGIRSLSPNDRYDAKYTMHFF